MLSATTVVLRLFGHCFIVSFGSTGISSNLGEWTVIHKWPEYHRFACSSKVSVDNIKNKLVVLLKYRLNSVFQAGSNLSIAVEVNLFFQLPSTSQY